MTESLHNVAMRLILLLLIAAGLLYGTAQFAGSRTGSKPLAEGRHGEQPTTLQPLEAEQKAKEAIEAATRARPEAD